MVIADGGDNRWSQFQISSILSVDPQAGIVENRILRESDAKSGVITDPDAVLVVEGNNIVRTNGRIESMG